MGTRMEFLLIIEFIQFASYYILHKFLSGIPWERDFDQVKTDIPGENADLTSTEL